MLRRILWPVLVILTLLLSACAPVAPSAAPAPAQEPPKPAGPTTAPASAQVTQPAEPAAAAGPSLRMSYGPEVSTLDKPSSGNSDVSQITEQIFANLVRLGPDGKIIGDFAESWNISPDGKVYTFLLRKGVKWSDGSRLITANDVKYSWERYFWPETKSPFPGWGLEDVVGYQDIKDGKTRELAGAKVLDDFTFQVTLVQPSGIFLSLIEYPTLNIVQKENVDKGTEGKPWWQTPVSSGPFMVQSWTTGQELVLVPNPNYHGTKPSVSSIVYKFIPDASARTLAYENGDLDILIPSAADIRAVNEQGKFQGELMKDKSNNINFIAFKLKTPPTDDQYVRQALTLAVDRELLNKAVLKGAYEAAKGWESSTAPWHNPDQDYLAFDAARAKEVAAKSKYGEPAKWPKLTFLVTGGATGTDTTNRLAVAMQAMWKENLGIDVEIKNVEDPAQAAGKKEGNILFGGVGNGFYDPHYVMDANAITSGWNNAWMTGLQTDSGWVDGYSNLELDKLVNNAKGEVDQAKRLKMYQDAEQMFLLDAPMVPLYVYNGFYLVKPYVRNLYMLPVWEIHLENVTIEK